MKTHLKVVNIDCRNDYSDEQRQIAAFGSELILRQTSSEQDIVDVCRDADVVLDESSHLPAHVIDQLQACQAIIVYGVGYDRVDVAAATRRGIIVANVADYCTEEVSDHAVALLLAGARRVVVMDRNVRRGGWYDFPTNGPIHRLSSLTLGLVGLGRIGRGVVRKMAGFSLKMLVTDPYLTPAAVPPGVKLVPLERLLLESDLISVHVPLGPETRGLIGEVAFRLMKPTALIVNTSRGPVIDETALARALDENRIAGAALDVAAVEPLPASSPLRKSEHVIFTPHYGASSVESVAQLRATVVDSVAALAHGYWPPFPVNLSVLPKVPLRPWSEFKRT